MIAPTHHTPTLAPVIVSCKHYTRTHARTHPFPLPNPRMPHTHARTPDRTIMLQEGGVLLVAPQHRLSMQPLKWLELWAKGEEQQRVCAALEAVARMPYLDILDESDELLHHR